MPDRTLVAVLATDLHGFQELLNRDEPAALELAARQKTVLGAAVKKHSGRILQTSADAYLISFPSACSAVQCAADSSALFSDHNERNPERKIRARFGVHIGEIIIDGQNIFGRSVHIAETLCGCVPPGGICISQEVHSLICGKIAHPFSYVGTRALEGTAEALPIYQDGGGIPPEAEAWVGGGGMVLEPAARRESMENGEPLRIPDPLADFEKKAGMRRREDGEKLPKEPPPQAAPITRAILSIDHRYLLFERIGGMRILERQLFTLERAGIKKVWLSTHPLKEGAMRALRWPKDLTVAFTKWSDDEEENEDICLPPYANVSGDHFLRPKSLRHIFSTLHERPTSYQDGNHRGIIQIALKESLHSVGFDPMPMPRGSFFPLSKTVDKERAVRWLLEETRKTTDSFMARTFDRKVSLALSRRLAETSIRPNQMTVFSSSVGAAGALLLASGSYPVVIIGALIVWTHTLLDGCDGELARLRFQESLYGGKLDFWGDNIVHALLFTCLGIGRLRAEGSVLPLFLGLTAAASGLWAAFLVYQHSIERREDNAAAPLFQGLEDLDSGWLAKIEHTLSQRDFIYLFVFLTIINRADIFLWAAGLGTPVFLAGLIFLRATSKKI